MIYHMSKIKFKGVQIAIRNGNIKETSSIKK